MGLGAQVGAYLMPYSVDRGTLGRQLRVAFPVFGPMVGFEPHRGVRFLVTLGGSSGALVQNEARDVFGGGALQPAGRFDLLLDKSLFR